MKQSTATLFFPKSMDGISIRVIVQEGAQLEK